MKVIVIGGYPGSGKSTIVRESLETLVAQGHNFILNKYGKLVPYMEDNTGFVVLGTYGENETFPGTDRFAMNAQPEVQEFLLVLKERELGEPRERVVLFEGDRLFNVKMLEFLKSNGFGIVLCIVETQQNLVEQRRQARSKQNEAWRKGRETKVDRISKIYPVNHWLINNTKEQQKACVEELTAEINGKWSGVQQSKTLRKFWD